MIGEALIDLFLDIFMGALSMFEFIGLPYEAISALTSVLAYGNWVVGLDLMVLFASSVVFWWVFKMSIGVIVWVWDRLPLT